MHLGRLREQRPWELYAGLLDCVCTDAKDDRLPGMWLKRGIWDVAFLAAASGEAGRVLTGWLPSAGAGDPWGIRLESLPAAGAEYASGMPSLRM